MNLFYFLVEKRKEKRPQAEIGDEKKSILENTQTFS